MDSSALISPNGGTLVNRLVSPDEAEQLRAKSPELPVIKLDPKQACDLEMIAIGAFSPLSGFVDRANFRSICKDMHTTRDCIWPIPITLAVAADTKSKLKEGGQAALHHPDGTLMAVIDVEEVYPHDKKLEIPSVFRTEDHAHPGVKSVAHEGDWCVGGPVRVLTVTPEKEPGEQFTTYRLPPVKTREAFEQRGWKTVAAFQTRNPIHRAHEYLTKCALEITTGLLIHPLVGETQKGDIPAEVRMDCYKILIEKYYVKQRTMLSVMPAAMRYAGPREAVMHAMVRRNYGVSHFIVGRDHAGTGDYYGTFDAQNIFDELDPAKVGITILRFEHAAWCNACGGMTSSKTCPHGPEQKIFLSGTKVREMLRNGERPPTEFSRPEVAEMMMRWAAGRDDR